MRVFISSYLKSVLVLTGLLLFTMSGLVATSIRAQVPQVRPSQYIDSFDSQITINSDTSMEITETIEFVTTIEKHGIFRYVPNQLKEGWLLRGTPLTVESVTDETGQKHQYEKSWESGNVVLKIGDPDRTFTGKKIYIIKYHVNNGLKEFEGEPELLWDITGSGWDFPIYQATTTITAPGDITKTACFTGALGSVEQDCVVTVEGNTLTARTTRNQVGNGSDFTVALRLDPQTTFNPSIEQVQKSRRIRDNWQLAAPLIPILILGWRWWRKGRDYIFYTESVVPGEENYKPFRLMPIGFRRRTQMVLQPPTDITPAQASLVMNERVTNRDVIAEIIDLARHKVIEIKPVANSKKNFEFTLLKPTAKLPAHQQVLVDKMFGGKTTVKLTSLKGKFTTTLETVKGMVQKSAVEKGWFKRTPNTSRVWEFIIWAVLNGGLGFLVLMYVSITYNWMLVLAFIVQAVVGFFFAYQAPQKTASGSSVMTQMRGLEKTIRYGTWREKIKEKHLFVDEVLPFAVAFGVVNQLAKDMKELGIPEPEYVHGLVTNQRSWAGALTSFESASSSSLSYSPSSSGSGFSGGGSSGGGGGGGGGGSW